jgi:hypothetical protein
MVCVTKNQKLAFINWKSRDSSRKSTAELFRYPYILWLATCWPCWPIWLLNFFLCSFVVSFVTLGKFSIFHISTWEYVIDVHIVSYITNVVIMLFWSTVQLWSEYVYLVNNHSLKENHVFQKLSSLILRKECSVRVFEKTGCWRNCLDLRDRKQQDAEGIVWT